MWPGRFRIRAARLLYSEAAWLPASLAEIAAELAAEEAAGPASFKEKLFDHLYRLDRSTCDLRQKVEVVTF